MNHATFALGFPVPRRANHSAGNAGNIPRYWRRGGGYLGRPARVPREGPTIPSCPRHWMQFRPA